MLRRIPLLIAKLATLYRYEAVAYDVSQSPADTPVYRFFNKRAGTHFYTSDEAEKQHVMAKQSKNFTFEGVGFYLAK